MSKSLDPDQNRCSVDPDLGPNCLEDTYSERDRHEWNLNDVDPCARDVIGDPVRDLPCMQLASYLDVDDAPTSAC